jgi:hypothetical protein
MSRASATTVSCVAAAALLLACAGTPGGAPGGDEPAVVAFSYRAVTPETVEIGANGNVRWVNTSQDTRGFVVLPASIAASFRCQELGPDFIKTPSGYQSVPLTGMQSDRVELPCALAPGSYDYEIWLTGSGFGEEAEGISPEQVLRAKIVVH